MRVIFLSICILATTWFTKAGVGIGLFQNGTDTLEVRLLPDANFNGIVSNVQFTIRWNTSSGANLGAIQQVLFEQVYIPMQKSGAQTDASGYRYQVFFGSGGLPMSTFGKTWTSGVEVVLMKIPVLNGCSDFAIVNDSWTADILNNGNYFVSLGGVSSTGNIYSGVIATCTGGGCLDVANTVNVAICQGDSYFAGGSQQTIAGVYYDTVPLGNGCDSIITSNLSVLQEFYFETDTAICSSDSIFLSGAFQNTPGTYSDTLLSSSGCDSIIATNLTVDNCESSSDKVDIGLFLSGNDTLEVRLLPHINFNGIVSNVQFTIRWSTSSGANLGAIQQVLFEQVYIPMQKSGSETDTGGFRYQVFFGSGGLPMSTFGKTWTSGTEVVLMKIPVLNACSDFAIINDSWTSNVLNNGNYFISLAGSDTTGIINTGDVSTCMNSTIEGAFVTEYNYAIPNVKIELTGSTQFNSIAGSNGFYNVLVNKGGSYSLTPSKDNDVAKANGVTTLDITLIRRHLLGISPLSSPYKIIAADVNSSNSVTTLDIAVLRKLILGIDTTFSGNKLWAFVPHDYVFANPQNPFPFNKTRTYFNLSASQASQNFIGMKLGDVNGNWNPNILKVGAVGEVQFAMNEYQTLPGDEIIVPVRVKDFNDIAGYQFTMTWNPEVIQFIEVVNQSIPAYYGEQSISEGMLTTSWNDGTGEAITLNDEAIAFELKFKVIGAIGTSTEIKIGSEITASEAYTDALDLLDITATDGSVKVGEVISSLNTQHSTLNTLQVQPNPFSNSTIIIFEIPQAENVRIVIYDLLGKEIRMFNGNYAAGRHSIEWNGTDNEGLPLSKGMYHVRMTAGENTKSLKALLLR